jgi:EAL domain-containing protein (putative c-di-GMP-specific phosphodiesterase class I)
MPRKDQQKTMPSGEHIRGAMTVAYLECFAEQGGPAERVPLVKTPFVIGRAESVDHTVYSSKVSKEHAAIDRIGDRYLITDLVSTNGTFVNGRRTVEAFLRDGDIIQIAHKEFGFRQPQVRPDIGSSLQAIEQTQLFRSDCLDSVMRGTQLLREMIESESVETQFQPIVDLKTKKVMGYEALTRGKHPKLSESPTVLLRLAEQCDMLTEVSQLFRRLAIHASKRLSKHRRVFLNVHAREISDQSFLAAIEGLQREVSSHHPVVFEIAEGSIADLETMATIKRALDERGFELAYDDFGIGQSRLLELTDVPPNYLKLDISLTQGMQSNQARRDMVSAVLRVVAALGTRVIAEGIESADVAEMCRDIGCHLGQGFYFGRPS